MTLLPKFNALRKCLGKAHADSNLTCWVVWELVGSIMLFPRSAAEELGFAQAPHLTKVSHRLLACPVYMVYLAETRAIFKILLSLENVKIAFISNFKMLYKILEDLLELPTNSLSQCLQIDYHKYLHKFPQASKAEQLLALKRKKIIGRDDFILLVDNMFEQVAAAFELRLSAVLAQGMAFEIYGHETIIYQASNIYLAKIIEVITKQLAESTQRRQSAILGFTVSHIEVRYSPGSLWSRPYFN